MTAPPHVGGAGSDASSPGPAGQDRSRASKHSLTSPVPIISNKVIVNQLSNEFYTQNHHITANADRINTLVKYLGVQRQWIADENNLYCFEGQYYHRMTNIEFGQMFRQLWMRLWDKYATARAEEAFKQLLQIYYIEGRQINDYPDYIPFQNGLFNITTGFLEAGRPEVYITNPLPYAYQKSKTKPGECPRFQQALAEILPDAPKRKKVLAFMAYTFTNSIRMQIAQMWLGPPNSGRTKLSEFLKKLQGEAVSTIAFRDIFEDRGAICGLKSKRLNLSSEIGGTRMTKVGVDRFKTLITDEYLSGRDAYKPREEWRNTTKHLFTSNNLPVPEFVDAAFWRRWQPIEFTEDFTDRENRTLFDDILRAEAPQVIAYILTFLPSITTELIADPRQTEQLWVQYSSAVQNYLHQCCYVGATFQVECTALYQDYCRWCREKGHTPFAQQRFGAKLSYPRVRRRASGHRLIYVYLGLQLKT